MLPCLSLCAEVGECLFIWCSYQSKFSDNNVSFGTFSGWKQFANHLIYFLHNISRPRATDFSYPFVHRIDFGFLYVSLCCLPHNMFPSFKLLKAELWGSEKGEQRC